MRVFLTGGTGFIGQPLTQALLRRGWRVTALVRNSESPQAESLRRQGAVLARGDVTDRESMSAAMSGADVVVHNAGMYEFGLDSDGDRRAQRINVHGTDNTLGLAHELGIPRTVYVSTVWAYGDSGPTSRDETFQREAPCFSAYERTKAEAHEIARRYQQRGSPVAIVCPNGVMGVNDHSAVGYFLRLYVNRMMPPMAWAPDSIYTFVEVTDLAEGVALTAEKGRMGETYFLCGEPKSLKQHFSVWNEKPGGFKSRVWMPAGAMSLMFGSMEPLQRAAGLPAFMSRETVRAACCSLNYSSAKAQRELGWTHRSARDMWHGVIDGEIALLAKRRRQGLLDRLKPLADELR